MSQNKRKIIKNYINATPLKELLVGDDLDIFCKNEEKKESDTKKISLKEKRLAKEKKYEEHYEQVKVISKWNKYQKNGLIPDYWQLFRNANTQFLSIGSIAWSQQEGLVAGVPDLTCIIDNKIIFIEMKRMSKKPKTARGFRRGLNDAQLIKFPQFEKCGYKPFICYSSEEVFNVLSEFTNVDFRGK